MRQAASAQTEIPTISPQPPRSGVAGHAGRAKKTGAHARAKVLVTATERESPSGRERVWLGVNNSTTAGHTGKVGREAGPAA